jgi:lysophospholipase L1-like esterase
MPIIIRASAVLLSLACVAFTIFTLLSPRQVPALYSTPPAALGILAAATARSDPPSVLFVGDSYTAGALGITTAQTFPRQTCLTLGLTCNLDAEGSTGYQADGRKLDRSFRPYAGRLSDDKMLYEADLVVISGGRNDVGSPGDEFRAVRTYLQRVRAAYPHAKLVVLEPFWTKRHAPQPITAIRRAVEQAASQLGASYLPTDGWLTKAGVAGDGVHPNREGHRQIAVRLIEALRRSGTLDGLGPA